MGSVLKGPDRETRDDAALSATYSMTAVASLRHEAMQAMANVTPGMFRRKMTFRLMRSVEEKIVEFKQAAMHDNTGAVTAGINDLTAKVLRLAGRPELAAEFDRARDRAIEDIEATPPMRKRVRKKRPPKA